MKTKNHTIVKTKLALGTLAANLLLAQVTSGLTITDPFTNAANWEIVTAAPTKAIGVAGGRMNFTATSTNSGGAIIKRIAADLPSVAVLPVTQDWSVQVDVHLFPFTLTKEGQYADVFLGFGKTGDEFNNNVMFEFGRGTWGLSHTNFYIEDNVRTNGVSLPWEAKLFNSWNLPSGDASLRMAYASASQSVTYFFDTDGPAGGYNWVAQGTANLASGTYNQNMSPTDTFTLFVAGSSEFQTVTAGQAYLANLVISVNPSPSAFTYITNNGTITITGYTGSGGAVSIPSIINDLPVKCIGNAAFYQITSLTNVTIGSGITNVGDSAFYECTSLTNVTIPSSVTSIGVFAFASCTNLTSLSIPESVTSLGDFAFSDCTSVTMITVDTNNPTFTTVGGVLFNKNLTTIIQYPVGKVGSVYAISNSVTNIGSGAFSSCSTLSNVMIPVSVSSIGDYAFNGCINLTSVQIPSSVTSLGDGAFRFCYALDVISIPSSITSVGYSAFGWSGLNRVTIPSSVTNIGDGAFAYCNGLTGVYFEGNSPSVSSTVFAGDNNVTVYYLTGTTGWAQWVSPPPAVLWNPQAQTGGPNFGVKTNRFGFNITGTTNIPIVVEASTNLTDSAWVPVLTGTLTNGLIYFSDSQCTNYPRRFYRIRSP